MSSWLRRRRDDRGPVPSQEALAALQDAEARHNRAIAQAERTQWVCALLRQHADENHYAERISAAFRGAEQ